MLAKVAFLALCVLYVAPGDAGLQPCGKPTVAQPGETDGSNPASTEEDRVVGGEPAAPGSAPWMAQFSWVIEEEAGVRCGGSLVAPGWVLTAAHCFYDNQFPRTLDYWKSVLTIGFGKSKLLDSAEKHQRNATLVDIIVHADYNPQQPAEYDNDIALVRLDHEVDYSEYIMPICLPSGELYQNHLSSGHAGTVMGWGTTPEGGEPARELMVAEIPLQNDSTCLLDDGEYTDNMICAGYPEGGIDSCQGDSGGPLIMNQSGTWYQIGVVSFGDGCARRGHYGYYTKVANYYSWIQSKIGNLAHGKPVRLSSTLDSNHQGLLATDGHTASKHYCASTTPGSTHLPHWLAVNLQHETYVTSIALTRGRMAGIFMYFDVRLHDFNVGVTNTISPVTYDLCNHHPGILEYGIDIAITCDRVVRGQYVVVHMTGSSPTDFLEVCEVKVYYDRTAICVDLTIANSNTKYRDAKRGEKVSVTCDDGYIVEGTSSSTYVVTCLQTGEWSTLPNCLSLLDTFRHELRTELTKVTNEMTLKLTTIHSALTAGIQLLEQKMENISECIKVNGQWGAWSQYSSCSVTCGGGTKQRSRECDNPAPDHCGDDCPGDGTSSAPCHENPCPAKCPDGFLLDGKTNTCLQYHVDSGVTKLDWAQAKRYCQNLGPRTYLAIIDTQEKLELVRGHLRQANVEAHDDSQVWIGGNQAQDEGRWFWAATGESLRGGLWGSGEPNNAGAPEDCLALAGWKDWTMNDFKCGRKLFYICQRTLN